MYQGAGEYVVFSCKCVSKVPGTNFLKHLGKLTEHSRAGDSFSTCSADCVEWLGSAEYQPHPVSTNCWNHLKIIVISGRLPVMCKVLMHSMICGMKQVLHVFRQNANQDLQNTLCKNSWGDLATKQWLLVAQKLIQLELLEMPLLLTSLLAPQGFESGSVQLTLWRLSLPLHFSFNQECTSKANLLTVSTVHTFEGFFNCLEYMNCN